MILLDSNLVIYATQPNNEEVRAFLRANGHAVSAISLVETLGFHRLGNEEREELERFFGRTPIHPLTDAVLQEAVRLRQERRMSLGDALIAGTALVHGLPLATHNPGDFRWISGLKVIDPLDR